MNGMIIYWIQVSEFENTTIESLCCIEVTVLQKKKKRKKEEAMTNYVNFIFNLLCFVIKHQVEKNRFSFSDSMGIRWMSARV